jgi:hypothetical protein
MSFAASSPPAAVVVVKVPVPAAVTDTMMVVNGMRRADADVGAEGADMGAHAHALATDACARANWTDIRAGADLRPGSAGKEQDGR